MKLSLILVLAFISFSLIAQAPNPPAGVPIDGGLSLVLAGGIGLGAKKLYDKYKDREN